MNEKAKNMKKVVIIGASSGVGKELAKIFAANGYAMGIATRRTDLLQGRCVRVNCY